MADEGRYLVWSNEHRRWWGPGHNGYVQSVKSAGRYTRTQALRICGDALGTAGHLGILAELPVLEADVNLFLAGRLVPAELA